MELEIKAEYQIQAGSMQMNNKVTKTGYKIETNDRGYFKAIPYIHENNYWFISYVPPGPDFLYEEFTKRPVSFKGMEVILKIYGFNLQKLVPVEMEAVANMLREPKTMGKTGYVYIIQAKCGGPVKIGFSRYPCAKGRLSQIQCTCPFELKIIAEFPNGMIKTEKEIHKKYDKYRLHNEWFDEAILPCIFSEYKEEI